jgi:hypothetical protein
MNLFRVFFFLLFFGTTYLGGLDHGKMMMGTNYIVVPSSVQHMFVETIN